MDGAMAQTEQSGDDSALTDGLTRREHDILAFERQWWKYAGSKEDAIKELFSMSATRYYQVLNALVDRPEALAADPMLVKRLRRLRASRQKARAARRLGLRRHLRLSCLAYRRCLDTVGPMNQRESSGLPLRAMVMVLLFLGVVFLLVGFNAMRFRRRRRQQRVDHLVDHRRPARRPLRRRRRAAGAREGRRAGLQHLRGRRCGRRRGQPAARTASGT